MTRALGLLFLTVVGCGDDASAPVAAPVPHVPGPQCVARAEGAAPDLARRTFPDNPDVTWHVRGVTSDAEGRAIVEMEPEPDTVGYPRFKLLIGCPATGGPDILATYALENGAFTLLSTRTGSALDYPPSL